jgi:hypothetical protein
MMGHREPLKSGDEQDAFAVRGRWRRLLCVFRKPGVAHRNKKRFSRRVRRAAKQERMLEC